MPLKPVEIIRYSAPVIPVVLNSFYPGPAEYTHLNNEIERGIPE